MVHAGLAAAPYLLRQRHWETAGSLLEQVLHRDVSVGTAAAVLPLLRRIVQATTGTQQELTNRGVLAQALGQVQPGADEPELRTLLETAHTRGQPHLASAIAGNLIDLLRDAGRLEEALSLADQTAEWTRQANQGPWTQLADQARRLHLLHRLGRHEQVLTQVQTLRQQMTSLPDTRQPNDPVDPWHVREQLLEVGAFAARELGRWEEALTLNAEVATSMQRRDAHPLEHARTRHNAYVSLLRLGRTQEARDLLHAARVVVANVHHLAGLAKVTGALAEAEAELGHRELAITLAQDALRLSYATGHPGDIAAGHYNLANYLGRASRDPAGMLAHLLAAAVIRLHTRQPHKGVAPLQGPA